MRAEPLLAGICAVTLVVGLALWRLPSPAMPAVPAPTGVSDPVADGPAPAWIDSATGPSTEAAAKGAVDAAPRAPVRTRSDSDTPSGSTGDPGSGPVPRRAKGSRIQDLARSLGHGPDDWATHRLEEWLPEALAAQRSELEGFARSGRGRLARAALERGIQARMDELGALFGAESARRLAERIGLQRAVPGTGRPPMDRPPRPDEEPDCGTGLVRARTR